MRSRPVPSCRSYRPRLEAMEERLLPGETLGMLLTWTLGTDPSFLAPPPFTYL